MSVYEGRIYKSTQGYYFKVLSVYKKVATIIFLDSGFTTTVKCQNLPSDVSQPVSVFCPYNQREDGTYIGTMSNKTMPSTDTDLYQQWRKLMDYAKKQNLPVDDELKCYATFLQNARNICNYNHWMLDENYRLVVNKHSNKVALNTILFISEETYQNEYRVRPKQETKPVMAYLFNSDGVKFVAKFKSVAECAKSLGIPQPSISMCLGDKSNMETAGGGVKSLNGWRFEWLTEDDEFLQ